MWQYKGENEKSDKVNIVSILVVAPFCGDLKVYPD